MHCKNAKQACTSAYRSTCACTCTRDSRGLGRRHGWVVYLALLLRYQLASILSMKRNFLGYGGNSTFRFHPTRAGTGSSYIFPLIHHLKPTIKSRLFVPSFQLISANSRVLKRALNGNVAGNYSPWNRHEMRVRVLNISKPRQRRKKATPR